mmetsp:Transcript_29330/g.86905  ORF Transcript_29330/g.86905 Transcript_29330/m.86905 type:complete len:108 (+) Transcript_29330:2815-3138(+)
MLYAVGERDLSLRDFSAGASALPNMLVAAPRNPQSLLGRSQRGRRAALALDLVPSRREAVLSVGAHPPVVAAGRTRGDSSVAVGASSGRQHVYPRAQKARLFKNSPR